ncbi:MAG TPA: protein kinase [Thermoanaerobaculia bacterium]|nr:protein kinase [Thermoanaerobaculia bacterium]
MALVAGTRLGPYEVIAPLGAGGMGEVYRAVDHRLGREVAVKTLPDSVLADPERRARFEREARALAALAHPAIATLHEIGEADGRPFLVMELVEGLNLSERLAAGPLPIPAALALAGQLAEGLAAAHARGIVHRDLKPSNLALTADGRLKILDFGLAKTGTRTHSSGSDISGSPTAALGLTSTGMLLGTAGYTSPEQVRGEPVDARADAWAFGCILFELLTGDRAFPGSSPWEVLAAVMTDTPAWSKLPRGLPVQVESVLRRCLEKDPARRLADLGEARLAISGPPSDATWVSSAPRQALWRLQHVAPRRVALWLIAGAAVLAAGLGTTWWWRRQPAPAPPPSLAILPFRNLGGGENAQWLGEGLAAAVSAQLADVRGVRVFPTSSTIEAVEKGADAMRVAKLLGADMVLSGSVQRAGGDLRVIFALIAAPVGNQVAGGTVTAPAGSLFAAQDELAGEVVAALGLPTAAPPTDDTGLPRPEQQDRYLKALGLLQRYDQAASVDAAITQLESLARDAPDSPLVHAALGRAFLGRLKLTRDSSWAPLAKSYCERARQLAPHRPEVELTLAQLALASGEPRKAVPLLRHALSVQPGNSDAMLTLAQAFDGLGETASAEETYRRLLALQPGYWAAYSKLGGFYFRHGRFRDAAAMFRRVTELNPDSARGFSNLAAALQANGQYELARAAAERSVAIEPTAEGLSNLGTLQFYLGQFAAAVDSFKQATRLAPASFEVWLNLGDAYRWAAGQRSLAGPVYAKAVELARQRLTLDPEDGSLRAWIAVALAKTGEHAAAERELASTRAESLGPDGLYAAAVVATLGGRTQEALGLLRKAVDAGYDRGLLARDPELRTLQGAPDLVKLLGDARRAA